MAMFRPCGARGVFARLRSGAHSSSRRFSCGGRALNGGLGALGVRMDGRRPALARAGRRFSVAARPYPDNDGRPERLRRPTETQVRRTMSMTAICMQEEHPVVASARF
jgi:hypothetical protein